MTIMAFLTWFGAAGYVLDVPISLGVLISIIGALAAGVIGAWLVNLFLVRVMLRGSTFRVGREYQVVGKLGEISMPVRPDALGEVIYTIDGTRHSDGARSADGLPIPRGTEVAIVDYEKGVAIVEPLQQLLEEEKRDTSNK